MNINVMQQHLEERETHFNILPFQPRPGCPWRHLHLKNRLLQCPEGVFRNVDVLPNQMYTAFADTSFQNK